MQYKKKNLSWGRSKKCLFSTLLQALLNILCQFYFHLKKCFLWKKKKEKAKRRLKTNSTRFFSLICWILVLRKLPLPCYFHLNKRIVILFKKRKQGDKNKYQDSALSMLNCWATFHRCVFLLKRQHYYYLSLHVNAMFLGKFMQKSKKKLIINVVIVLFDIKVEASASAPSSPMLLPSN